jgi:hypothetical protein
MKEQFLIRNWGEFQHYKQRNPPWIKLHFATLASEDWVIWDDASRVLAITCMLIASRNDGKIPNNPKYLQRVGYLNDLPDFQPLVDCGFLQVVENIEPSASICVQGAPTCKQKSQVARPETETEADTDPKRFNTDPPTPSAGGLADPLESFNRLKKAYPKINQAILRNHPKAIIPAENSRQEFQAKKTLAALSKLDKYTEDEICGALNWVLNHEPSSGGFAWRDQFRSIAQLREVKNGATKFTKMFEAWKRALGSQEPEIDPDVAEANRKWRESQEGARNE